MTSGYTFEKLPLTAAILMVGNAALTSGEGTDSRFFPAVEKVIEQSHFSRITVFGGFTVQKSQSAEVDQLRRDTALSLINAVIQMRAAFGIRDILTERS